MTSRRTVLAVLFLASGASGLIYETAWTRLYQDIFGHSVHTTAAVLAGYMAGLALGAGIAGLWADRLRARVRLYGILEIVIAALVWFSPSLVHLVDGFLGSPTFASTMWGEAARWLLAFKLLVVPAAIMGATLPLLVSAMTSDDESIGRDFGLLYGANTLGAVVGVFAAGYWLILHFGVVGTIRAGCGLSLAAGLGALAMSHWIGEPAISLKPADDSAEITSRGSGRNGVIYFVVFASGFTALAYEVIWIRQFVFLLGSSILSFSAVLGTLLAAFGVGSIIMPLIVRSRKQHLMALVWIEILVALGALLTLVLFARSELLTSLLSFFASAEGGGPGGFGRVLTAALILGVPGLALGATLPAATGAIDDHRRVGRGVGRLYLANTIGNILGSLAAGYLLVPSFGVTRSVEVLAVVNVVLAAVLLWRLRGEKEPRSLWAPAILIACLAIGFFVIPGLASAVFGFQNPHGRLIGVKEGLRGTVTIHDIPPIPLLSRNTEASISGLVAGGYRLIAVEGVDVAGTAPDLRTTQKMQAHIPLLLHGSARRVLQIGYGSGETTVEANLHPSVELDLAEINPDVILEANRWLPEFAGASYRSFFGDAKNYVRNTDENYDVILNDSTYPGLAGSSQLYSQDHLRACRSRLNAGGIVSTWLPVDLPEETFRLVLATFASIFPEVSFWLPSNCWNKHGVLVGSLDPMSDLINELRVSKWPQAVRGSLGEMGYQDSDVFASMMVLDSAAIRGLTEGVRINSDDRPFLEYPARGSRVAGEQFWGETLRLIIAHLPENGLADALRRCVSQVLTGELALLDGDSDRALRFYERAGVEWPQHPGPPRLRRDIEIFRAQAAFSEGIERLVDGEKPLAFEAFAHASELCPVSAAAAYEAGRLLFEAGRPVQAIPFLERCSRFARDLPRADLFLGDAFAFSARPADAELAYKRYLDQYEPQAEIMIALADVIAEQGKAEEARALIERVRELFPDNPAVIARVPR